MPDAKSGSVIGTLEQALKLVAGGAVVVAAMGFPAVYIHFLRFNIPTSFISYDLVLRAGAVPVLLLLPIGVYGYWVAKLYVNPSKEENTSPIVLPESASTNLNEESSWSFPGRFVSISIRVIGLSGPPRIPIPILSIDVPAKYIALNIPAKYIFILPVVVYWVAVTRILPQDPLSELGYDPPSGFLGIFVEALPTSIMIIIFYLFVSGAETAYRWITQINTRIRRQGFVLLITLLILAYLFLVSAYSYTVYPNVPRGLGGGKLEEVTVWLSTDNFPEDAIKGSAYKCVTVGEKFVRCDHLYLLGLNDKQLILLEQMVGPTSGWLVPRGNVHAISWPVD